MSIVYEARILRGDGESIERKTLFARAEAEYEKGHDLKIWDEWISPNWWTRLEVYDSHNPTPNTGETE